MKRKNPYVIENLECGMYPRIYCGDIISAMHAVDRVIDKFGYAHLWHFDGLKPIEHLIISFDDKGNYKFE